MSEAKAIDFSVLYRNFQPSSTKLDCGKKCAPYNESGEPFCCDTQHAIPTAYLEEWKYLRANTNLWHLWQARDPGETARMQAQTPPGQVMIACLGASLCQRGYRALTCRAFPFFPYITLEGEFIGLSYYWEYEDLCWVISNLSKVTSEYRFDFVAAYDEVFDYVPQEKENFRHYSTTMRRIFGRKRRALPLLHRSGLVYKISPGTGRMRRVPLERLPKFGPYRIADLLPFPGEDGG